MKVLHVNEFSILEQQHLALCLGFFDGMHLAHRALMNKTINEANKRHLQKGIMTFSTHVLSYLKDEPFFYLSSLEDKMECARKAGFDYFYVLDVTEGLVSMEPEEFITRFLKQQDLIVVGFDYSFGRYGKGKVDTLLQHKEFRTIVVQEMVYYHEKIGSTKIRDLIDHGNMEVASVLIGKNYQIKGEVVHGHGRGKGLGFPTANLANPGYLVPKTGLYIARTNIDGTCFYGLANVGFNPTFVNDGLSIEMYLFDTSLDLYGRVITIEFLSYLREEMKFDGVDALIKQMKLDEENAKRILQERNFR